MVREVMTTGTLVRIPLFGTHFHVRWLHESSFIFACLLDSGDFSDGKNLLISFFKRLRLIMFATHAVDNAILCYVTLYYAVSLS